MIRRWLIRSLIITLTFTTAATAQYTSPGMGGTSGVAPGYTKKSYGVNKAVMAAVIGAGVGGGIFLFKHHHRPLTACVGPDGTTLDDGKDIYTIVGAPLTPGEHLIAAGKRVKSDGGAPAFEVTSVRKDLGRCERPPAVSAQE